MPEADRYRFGLAFVPYSMVRLPLFPLAVTLFPGASLPLHIFEPRYRRLLADAIEADHRFVLLPHDPPGEPPPPGAVGSVALIRAVQPLEDGRSNIAVLGEGRVELTAVEPSDHPYLVGSFTPYQDVEETQGPAPADLLRLDALGRRLAAALATIADADPAREWSDDPARLTFQIAELAAWDFPVQQRFLAIRSPAERVARLLASLPVLVGRAEGNALVHQRASTNGSGKH